MAEKYDFRGWATRNNIRCSDNRVIMRDAFADCDGKTVPLVWNHQHNTPDNILGHALLENRPQGVYVKGTFNETESGQEAKELVEHGDVTALSIYANQVKQNGDSVVHGRIREVSLVLAGANPGAYITNVEVAHSDEEGDGIQMFVIDEDAPFEFEHSEEDAEDAEEASPIEHADEPKKEESVADEEKKDDAEDTEDEETVQDVIDTMNDKQKNVMYALIGAAADGKLGNAQNDEESDDGSDEEEGTNVKHNLFDEENVQEDNVIEHSDIIDAIHDAKRYGSMKESFEEHGIGDITIAHSSVEPSPGTATYGVDGVNFLFPDARNLTDTPMFIQRKTDWVNGVLNGAHHSPFARTKSMFANITADEARARGYIKGNKKRDEVFKLLRRTTDPQTIYKRQKMDRDDVIDITDFDVIAWLKGEMRMMLNEEIARAALVGDGRSDADEDKIQEDHVRPIWKDDDLFTIKATVEGTGDELATNFIREALLARVTYRGTGNPVLYTTEEFLTNMLLLTDKDGRDLYDSVDKLATKLRVSSIVTVPVMEGLSRKVTVSGTEETHNLMGIIVNMADYNFGTNQGGQVSMFDDFDIDYNQQKYLIETRLSGALTVPYSAIALEQKVTA